MPQFMNFLRKTAMGRSHPEKRPLWPTWKDSIFLNTPGDPQSQWQRRMKSHSSKPFSPAQDDYLNKAHALEQEYYNVFEALALEGTSTKNASASNNESSS